MENSYNAVIAKAKVIYGNSLTREDYDNLLRRGSLKSAVAYLKTTARYGAAFAELTEANSRRANIEYVLRRDSFTTYEKLRRFIPTDKNGFLSFALRRREVRIILSATTLAGIGEFDKIARYIPEDFAASFDITALTRANSVGRVLDALHGTRYHRILFRLIKEDKFDNEEVSEAMYADYYKWAKDSAKKEFGGNSKLLPALRRQEGLEKLLSDYRRKAFFTPGGEKEAQAVLDEIDEKYFKSKIGIDKSNLELAIRWDAYNFYRRLLRTSDNYAEVLFAFFHLTEVQRQNVAAIIESIQYSLPITEIEKLLVV